VLSEGIPIDGETLRYIHSRKTGALMSAACKIGAVLGGGTESQVESLGAFGETVGLAFQIADDILNETADAGTLGKAVGTDRKRAKATYTALFGLEEAEHLAQATALKAKSALAEFPESTFLSDLADFTVRRLH